MHHCKHLSNLAFYYDYRQNIELFDKFVTWVLSSRDDSCSLLNLVIENQFSGELIDPRVFDSVIEYAVLHNVRNLKLDVFSPIVTFESLSLIFCSQSLTSLKLCIRRTSSPVVVLPKSFDLPALKSLRLNCVGFAASGNECAEPFSNCRVLNTLVLKCFSLHDDARVLWISNSSLSSLKISHLLQKQVWEVRLSTPKLSSFTIKGFACDQLSTTCNLSFLEEVNIFHRYLWETSSISTLLKWLKVLANVKILTLTSVIILMILPELSNMYSRTPQPPCFVRLELLKVDKQVPIKISDKEVTRVVDFLLQNSPSAKVDIS
ncbi:uncharacterized protein LOC109794526 [Cajanus cajan]|uniref:uncharacterized protein LOC109794526 n=1 Tax=Cajanus cajan TaxID=3821 RepID=UPI00098DB53F|nr:uncharacterized protein LOC109794526 [Cajanus cajan]